MQSTFKNFAIFKSLIAQKGELKSTSLNEKDSNANLIISNVFPVKVWGAESSRKKVLTKARNLEISEGLQLSTESGGNFSGATHALTSAASLEYFSHFKSREKNA